MILSDVSIKRPVLASVISLIIVLGGIAAYFNLPVRQYPNISQPVVSVTTDYIGASPATIEAKVTLPLEESLTQVEGVRDILSYSSFGESSIDIEFVSNRNVDAAAQDVTNAVNQALGELPNDPNLQKPIIKKVGSTTAPIMFLTLQGKNYSLEQLTEYAQVVVQRRLQTLSGVGNVIVPGAREWAIRVWLNPKLMAAHDVDVSDVVNTLNQNNVQLPAGQIESNALLFNINTPNGQMINPNHYGALVIKEVNGVPVRIRDIGWVQLGAQNYTSLVRLNGKPAVGIGIIPQSDANSLAIAKEVDAALPGIRAVLPRGVNLTIAVDKTEYIRESLSEVYHSIFIAFGLVVLVVLFFLHTWRATLIPVVAIPVSIIGTFAGMWALGFSINTLTLFSLVLSIGLVVDDAIVMLENIYRRQELGEPRLLAAINGAREIGFPVLATTISLIAIFVPLSMMQGYIGSLFHEFGVSVAISVAISGLVALTLTPALCALILRRSEPKGPFKLSERGFHTVHRGFGHLAAWLVSHKKIIALVMIGNIALMVALFALLPKTVAPVEDQGIFFVDAKAPQGSNMWFTHNSMKKIFAAIKTLPPIISHVFQVIGLPLHGPASQNEGLTFVRLVPFDQRNISQMAMAKMLNAKIKNIPGVRAFAVNPPSLGENFTQQDLEFVVMGPSLVKLGQIEAELTKKLRSTPGIINVQTNLANETHQITVYFNRERAADLGIPIQQIAQALEVGLGGAEVSNFVMDTNYYYVMAQFFPKYAAWPGDINNIYLRTASGQQVPLSWLVTLHVGYGPDIVNHYDLQRAFTLGATVVSPLSTNQALSITQKDLKQILPAGYRWALYGATRDYARASQSLDLTFAVALIFIYLVLAAQFESWVHPLTIMLGVPFALTGALLTLWLSGQSLNLYSEIGIIMLIGLVTKNTILLVEYTNQNRAHGAPMAQAAVEAAKIRFRPIVMTTMTMIMGSLPMAIATGAGAQSRQPLGLSVVGGLAFSTMFVLVVTPVFYLLITSAAERLGLKTLPPKVELIPVEAEAEMRKAAE